MKCTAVFSSYLKSIYSCLIFLPQPVIFFVIRIDWPFLYEGKIGFKLSLKRIGSNAPVTSKMELFVTTAKE